MHGGRTFTIWGCYGGSIGGREEEETLKEEEEQTVVDKRAEDVDGKVAEVEEETGGSTF